MHRSTLTDTFGCERRRRRRHFRTVGFILPFVALLCAEGAWGQTAEVLRGGAGAPVVIDPKANARTEPEALPYRKLVEGLYARKVFRTVSREKEYSLEVWGLLVGPGKETKPFSLPGSAILVTRSGSAILMVGKEKKELRLGTTLWVTEKDELRLINRDPDRPVSIKATIIAGIPNDDRPD